MNEPSLDRLKASMAATVAKMAEAVAPLSKAIRAMERIAYECFAEPEEFPNRKARRKAAALARRGAR